MVIGLATVGLLLIAAALLASEYWAVRGSFALAGTCIGGVVITVRGKHIQALAEVARWEAFKAAYTSHSLSKSDERKLDQLVISYLRRTSK